MINHTNIKSENAKEDSVENLLQKLASSKRGLSTPETEERLQKYGYNEIVEKKPNPIVKFFKYFWGPIPWMIEVAALLSAINNDWEEFFIIFSLLILNAVVGFWQEHKAGNAIENLKKRLALNARALRDGKWTQIPARELVPGDIIRVRLGDIVPADLKLLEGDYLSIDESALTGESLPVEKHASDVAYSGSIVRQGEMDGLVITTGLETFFGRTAKLVTETETTSHFQKVIVKIGNYLIILALLLVMVIFLTAIIRHESFPETLRFALVLSVAAIPAALPAILSITMAIGATKLAKKEAIVSKLVAIEEMAGMDVLCSDKTGTITENKLTIGEIIPFDGFTSGDVLLYATLSSREEDMDPIDTAVITETKKNEDIIKTLNSHVVLKYIPFDPVSKHTEAKVENDQHQLINVAKGAPQTILSFMTNMEKIAQAVDTDVNAFASRGYRTIAVAKKDASQNWQFVGLIALYDPPREDSAETIKTAESLGVQVKMITGDHEAIAKEIAGQVNLGTNIQLASAFLDKSDTEAEKIIENVDGFARVFPEHKYEIVELLQEDNHIVGMTGDGVNDAPALKKADAGIAVAGATDAAKSAADIVLTKPGLSVIVDAIKESRKIFQRMNSYAIYRITETIRILFFITLSIIIFGFYPVSAVMIVLLALLNDAPIIAIAYDNVIYSNKPEKWNLKIVLGMATFLGAVGVVFSFMLFFIGENVLLLNRDVIQSLIFLKLSVAGHLTLFAVRTRGPFWSIKPSKVLLGASITTQLIATIVTVFGLFVTPIGLGLAVFVWVYALAAFIITDFLKRFMYKVLDNYQIRLPSERSSKSLASKYGV
ncbi:MAG: plasma-membrane proton-efflux P-type ATPase [Candidatus Odinarchaeota archaeon]